MKITFISTSRFFFQILLPLSMFPLIFWLQVNLGYEIGLFPLYMIPVARLSWDFGVKGMLFGTVLAIFCWLSSNLQTGQEFSIEWFRYFNAAVRGLIYLLTGITILLFKHTLDTHRKRMEAMREMLNVCHGCGSLQGSNGEWVPMDQLKTGLNQNSHECPICAKFPNDES